MVHSLYQEGAQTFSGGDSQEMEEEEMEVVGHWEGAGEVGGAYPRAGGHILGVALKL